ncbi:Hypothetical protein CINCED_3A020905 [Cinara cedri]|uniref:Uncharacterized protein n=1 Tax=Cinara cedri TaxID=506608 RepID=A0A5E4MD65_9HEMI|nr:Hypothetical protein CINCED_3A020905 [Cinara cedri]
MVFHFIPVIVLLYIILILTYAGLSCAPYDTKNQWRRLEAIRITAVRTIIELPLSKVPDPSQQIVLHNFFSNFEHIENLRRSDQSVPINNNLKPRFLQWTLKH